MDIFQALSIVLCGDRRYCGFAYWHRYFTEAVRLGLLQVIKLPTTLKLSSTKEIQATAISIALKPCVRRWQLLLAQEANIVSVTLQQIKAGGPGALFYRMWMAAFSVWRTKYAGRCFNDEIQERLMPTACISAFGRCIMNRDGKNINLWQLCFRYSGVMVACLSSGTLHTGQCYR